MDLITLLQAGFLGVIEGLTEFIPVSSTGHLILLTDLLGFRGPSGQVFEIVIQLGAILAVVVAYAPLLTGMVLRAPTDPAARRFLLAVSLAFLPAAVVGALAHDFIKLVLFSPLVVGATLVLGGIAILYIERRRPVARHADIAAFSPRLSLGVGGFQVLAMVPGISRSGATIMGALILGVERGTATLFSFFLAIPTMLAASLFDLYKNLQVLDLAGATVIAVGFVTAFLSAMLVVRSLVGFISRNGFGAFAWYRIAVGLLMLGVLMAR